MLKMGRVFASSALVMGLLAVPVCADLSAFVAAVGFDEEASLEGGMGIGLRWGRFGKILGGETSLLVARPERQIGNAGERATALFYEGRFMVRIPTGTKVSPFAGVGLGAITVTSTDVEKFTKENPGVADAVNAVADLQTNTSLSYGLGVKFSLSDRLELRGDLRQYLVFSVTGYAEQKAQEAIEEMVEEAVGMDLPAGKAKDNTVQYNELSVGVNFRF